MSAAPSSPGPVPVEPSPATAAATEASEIAVPVDASKVAVPVEPPEAEDAASADTEIVASANPSPTSDLQNVVASGDAPAGVKPDDLIGAVARNVGEDATPQHQITSQHQVAELVEGVRRGSDEMASGTADRVLGIPKSEPDLLPGLIDLAAPSPADGALAGDAPAGAGLREAPPAVFPELQRQVALLPSPDALGLRPSLGEYIAAGSTSAIVPLRDAALRDWQPGLLPRAAISETALASADPDRTGGSPPTDLPSPTPRSPATAVGDAGGSSFVPIVALLALLALAAPTTRRRLGEVADFRAPTRFVCALERPG